MQSIIVGTSIESRVCEFLATTGLKPVCRNYRCRLGEIDLVMRDPDATLVFVEVRYRSGDHFGSATESVDRRKSEKLKRAVLHYLQKHADATQRARIDVVGVDNAVPRHDFAMSVVSPDTTVHEINGYRLIWTRNAIED